MIELDELKSPQVARPDADRVVAATDAACLEHLDEEYADRCRRLVGKLFDQSQMGLIPYVPAAESSDG